MSAFVLALPLLVYVMYDMDIAVAVVAADDGVVADDVADSGGAGAGALVVIVGVCVVV